MNCADKIVRNSVRVEVGLARKSLNFCSGILGFLTGALEGFEGDLGLLEGLDFCYS